MTNSQDKSTQNIISHDIYNIKECYNKNPNQAFKIIQNYAQKGHLQSTIALSTFYKEGIGTEKNIKKSHECMQKALYRSIEHNNTHAKRIDIFNASNNLKLKEKLLYIEAENSLGFWHQYLTGKNLLNGANGYPKDKIAACHWLKKSSDAGLPHADFELYKLATTMPEYKYAAYNYLRKSAEANYAPAMKEIATIYISKKMYQDAYLWLRLAGNKGENVTQNLQNIENFLSKKDKEMVEFFLTFPPNHKVKFKIFDNLKISTLICGFNLGYSLLMI
jgi:TPR repeat protein